MYTYRLRYLVDSGIGDPKTYQSETPVSVGDVIDLGFYHCVYRIRTLKSGVFLDLAESDQSPEEAMLLAEDLEGDPRG